MNKIPSTSKLETVKQKEEKSNIFVFLLFVGTILFSCFYPSFPEVNMDTTEKTSIPEEPELEASMKGTDQGPWKEQ